MTARLDDVSGSPLGIPLLIRLCPAVGILGDSPGEHLSAYPLSWDRWLPTTPLRQTRCDSERNHKPNSRHRTATKHPSNAHTNPNNNPKHPQQTQPTRRTSPSERILHISVPYLQYPGPGAGSGEPFLVLLRHRRSGAGPPGLVGCRLFVPRDGPGGGRVGVRVPRCWMAVLALMLVVGLVAPGGVSLSCCQAARGRFSGVSGWVWGGW